MRPNFQCRFCDASLRYTFADLGSSPLANSFIPPEKLFEMEPFYPLTVFVCESCLLVQIPEFERATAIFDEYAYFSSYSESWLEHARNYVDMITARLGCDGSSQVVEIASNDGYLLQYFKERKVPVLGIEPAANVARAAEERGIPTVVDFFGASLAQRLAEEGKRADLIVGNNVLAHVPDINGFVKGLQILLKPGGSITMEFPHLMRLIEFNQFDTIYHEHFSYLSLYAVEKIFAAYGLSIYDVEELPTHGGSLRIFAQHAGERGESSERLSELRRREEEAGLRTLEGYLEFQDCMEETKRRFLGFLIDSRNDGKQVVGYGAPAKGNTLLNYCGVRGDLLRYTVDKSPHKQGRYLPGTRIPIHAPEKILETRPDYVVILPWNLKQEVMQQMKDVRSWGGKFVVPIPEVEVLT